MIKSEKSHASCVSVFGVGVLINGPSGVGKTECALGLVARGHRFVADDIVVLSRAERVLLARPDAVLGSRAHVRDVGVIDAAELFGVTEPVAQLGLTVTLEAPLPGIRHPACGIEPDKVKILDVILPRYTLVAYPGRDLPLLIEIAVRNESAETRNRLRLA